MKLSFLGKLLLLWALGCGACAQQEAVLDNSTVFRLFIETKTFVAAEQACSGLNQGNSIFNFSLARVDSTEEFNFIIDEFNLADLNLPQTIVNGIVRKSIWIGLKRVIQEEASESLLDGLQFLDGDQSNTSFFSDGQVFPWDSSQPNNLGGVQNCVSWETLSLLERPALRWYDDECEAEMSAFLCRGEAIVTTSPTLNPTTFPTLNPTASPTLKPTTSPVTTNDPGDGQITPEDAEDSTIGTVFLSIAATTAMLIVFLVFFILREKKDLKALQEMLQALETRDHIAGVEITDETDSSINRLL